MKRLATILAASALAAGVLSGCGGGNDYCDAIKDANKSMNAIDDPTDASNDTLSKAADSFSEVAGSAPDGVKDDWNKLGDTIEKMVSTLDDAGVDIKDLQDQEAMSKLDPDVLKQVQESLSGFSDVTSSADAVEKSAKDECDIDLGTS